MAQLRGDDLPAVDDLSLRIGAMSHLRRTPGCLVGGPAVLASLPVFHRRDTGVH